MGRRSLVRFVSLSFSFASLLLGPLARAQSLRALDQRADDEALAKIADLPFMDLCSADVPSGTKRCFAKVVTDGSGHPLQLEAAPRTALGPAQLRAAYKLPSTGGAGKNIALVDAFHYTNAEADLATYRSMFGLPPCTTANGCFKQVDATGAPSKVAADPMGCGGWAGEAALDLQMASATCPDCSISLVEVDGANGDFSSAVDGAAMLGAVAISNSYGGSDTRDDPSYNHTGVLITAATGDSGYGVSSPATYSGVVAVGGTTLTQSTSTRGWAEAAWGGAGSGCSKTVAKPSWQNEMGCAKRAVADVSAVADPRTGVAVYCSDKKGGGWQLVGGTSAAAPIIAGAFTILNVSPAPSYVWQNPMNFFDVTTGKNGTCTTGILCTAGAGWDGPTGWGSPNGALILGGTAPSDDAGAGSGGSGSDAGSGGSLDASRGNASDGSTSSGSSGGGSSSGTASSSGGSGAVGSSSGSGSTSGGSSSSGAGVDLADGGAGLQDASANNSNGLSWNPNAGGSCGCSTVGARNGYGAFSAAGGLLLGWAVRRRRSRR